MKSIEIARKRILSLISGNEPSDICFEAKFKLRAHTVAEWRQGTGKTFMNILPEIAKEYGVTTDWLLGNESTDIYPDMIEVPTVGVIQAGYPIESYELYGDIVRIPKDLAPTGEVYALDVRGDSMLPLVMDKDKIIVEKATARQANGEICVITVDGESTLKRFHIDSTGVTLTPLNPMYKELHYSKKECLDKNLTVDGILVQVIRNVRNRDHLTNRI